MAVLNVLINAKGEVLGTTRDDDSAAKDAPRATLVAGKGQRVVTLTVEDKALRSEPATLHKLLKKEHARDLRAIRRTNP